jgi:hypothetical protein
LRPGDLARAASRVKLILSTVGWWIHSSPT